MKVIREIDRGGFGRVDEVELHDGTRLARKVFDPNPNIRRVSTEEKLRMRFMREVRYQSNFTDESFIPVLDFQLEGPELWYTMPLCEKNLLTEINEQKLKGTIPTQALIDVMGALITLHELDFAHRDLNPRNVLFHDGKWKLSDFGLVSPPEEITANITSSMSTWGTTAYMAPEQVLDFDNANQRADIYAFGCILHDIFGNSARVPYHRHSCEGPVGMLIEMCTEPDPDLRVSSISAVQADLMNILSGAISLTPSLETSEWVEQLKDISDWDVIKLRSFVRFVSAIDGTLDLWNIFIGLGPDHLERFYSLNPQHAEILALKYC